jgi:hypothetical protein
MQHGSAGIFFVRDRWFYRLGFDRRAQSARQDSIEDDAYRAARRDTSVFSAISAVKSYERHASAAAAGFSTACQRVFPRKPAGVLDTGACPVLDTGACPVVDTGEYRFAEGKRARSKSWKA